MGEQIMASKLSAAVSGRRDRKSIRPGIGGLTRRAGPAGLAAVAAAGLLAACGSAGTGANFGAGGASVAQGTAASRGTVISVRKLPGVGTVLVDRSGKTLYSAQQEADGKIICTGGCLGFWFPVRVAAGAALHAPSGVTGALGTVHRPGGMSQLTVNGRPLYTFRLDQVPGQVHGNNFTDTFGGTSFTWHALTTSGEPAGTGSQQDNSGGYSYQSGSPGY
jgi:predicted lipoprotein with Yx(FWY)xxD motif